MTTAWLEQIAGIFGLAASAFAGWDCARGNEDERGETLSLGGIAAPGAILGSRYIAARRSNNVIGANSPLCQPPAQLNPSTPIAGLAHPANGSPSPQSAATPNR
jgi:hypothetical protein